MEQRAAAMTSFYERLYDKPKYLKMRQRERPKDYKRRQEEWKRKQKTCDDSDDIEKEFQRKKRVLWDKLHKVFVQHREYRAAKKESMKAWK